MSSLSSLPVIQQLKTTLRLAVTLTLWGASTVTASSVGPKRFVVTSTSDALRLARTAFRVGTIIDAVVVGSVEVVKPIQIGNFTRLTLKGRGAGAQLTYSLNKGSASGATPDFEHLPCATYRNEPGLFVVGGNASLVVDNLSILQQNTSCAGPTALIKLHSHGLVDAKGYTFGSSIRSTSSDGGDGTGSRQASPLTIYARRGSVIRILSSGRHADKAVSAIESGRGPESVPSSSLLVVVLEEGAEVVTLENAGDEGNRFDHGTDDASWLALDAFWKTRVFPLTSDALYLWVYPSSDRIESSAPTWRRRVDFLIARSAKGEGEDDDAAAMAFRMPFTHWKKHRVLDSDRLQVEGSFYIGKTEVWDDSGDEDGDDQAEQGRWEKARSEGYAGNRWIGEKVRIGADIDAKIEIARMRERMDGDFQRQLDDYSCPEGYRGASCTDCASGFTMGPGGACARTEVQCTPWTEFGGGLLAALGLSIFLLALDAVRNGKSPTHRLAQIWQKAIGCCRTGGMFCQDLGTPILTPNEVAESRAARRGLDGINGNCMGRKTLARLLYGCMTFIVTAQIITQSTKVLELELSSAMEEVVAGLDWANMDPLLVPVACSSVTASFPSFPDRVVGTVGLLTACLAVLAFSQTTIAMCGGSPEVNEQDAPTRRSSMSHFAIDVAVGDREIHSSRAPRATQRANGDFFEHPDQMSSAGTRLEGLQNRGAWEQWESWDSSDRHAFAAIMVCFLMYPVVCTMLLGMFDCRSIEEDDALWLRTDLSIECSSQHQTYLVVAAVFLGLYGIGIPLALVAIVFWAKTSGHDEDQDDKLSAGNENNMVGSTSTTESYVVPLASRGLTDSSVDAKTFAAASLPATVSAQGEEGDVAAAAEARSTTRDASRQRYPGVVDIRRYQSSTNKVTSMDRSAQIGGSGSKVGFMTAFREETDVELGTEHHLTGTSLDEKGEGKTTRQDGEHFPGNSNWQDARLFRGDSDHAGWRVTDRGNPILVSNTSVTTPDDEKSCVARAWNLSGHCVLSVGMAISSKTGLSMSSTKEDINRLGKRWRCTIPLWWPYRTNRRWFAAWDLLRRTLLTGLLTLVPVDEGGAERVTVACAIAGLSLVVAEVARPHRDPWIGWIYRMGGIMILLVDMLGVLQQVSSAGSATPSVATVTVSVIFLLFLPLMLLCICCGWRLSCAEQRAGTSTAAAAIPWPESALYRRHPSGVGEGAGNYPYRGDNDSDQAKCSRNLPPNVRVLWDKEGPLSGDESGSRDLRSAINSESGSGESRAFQNTPSGRRILSSDSEHLSNSSRRSVPQPSPKQLPQLFAVSASLHNPMHSNSSGISERLSETARSDSSNRSSTYSCSIGLQMPSQSPAPMAGASIKRAGFGFKSASGDVSSAVRMPVEAHQTASGRAYHSNCGKDRATCAQVISLSNLDANEIGVNPPTLATRSRSCSNSSGLDGFADDSNMARRLLNIGAKAAEGRITASIIAPGAPSIDDHKSRLARNARPTRSSSSFISTSFESSTTGERSRKGSASRGRGGLRRSASSGGFFNGSRSQSGSRSGDVSRSPGVRCSSAGCALNSPHQFEETTIRVGFSRGRPSVIKKISTSSGSFMSSGSSTMGINGWVNTVVGPPPLRSLRTKSSQDFEMYGSPCSLNSGFGSEGISEVMRVSSRVERGLSGSPVNPSSLSEVSALSRWIDHEHGGDGSFAEEGGLGSVTAADVVAATGEREVTAEQKAPVDRVESVLGKETHTTQHRSSIPEGGRDVAQLPTLFIQEGASAISSYKSRVPEGSGSGGCIDAEDAGNATRKPCPSIARNASDQRYWEGDTTTTPLSSFA